MFGAATRLCEAAWVTPVMTHLSKPTMRHTDTDLDVTRGLGGMMTCPCSQMGLVTRWLLC